MKLLKGPVSRICSVYNIIYIKPLSNPTYTQWDLKFGLGGCWIIECPLPYMYVLMYSDCTSYNGRIKLVRMLD